MSEFLEETGEELMLLPAVEDVKIEGEEEIVGDDDGFDVEFSFLQAPELVEGVEEEGTNSRFILIRMEKGDDDESVPLLLSGEESKNEDERRRSEFNSEMENAICEVINECVHVLHKDPREYHPFYLRTHKYISLGREKGYFGDEGEVDSVWEKWDKFGATLYEESGEGKVKGEEFDGPRSAYLRYILEKKVYFGERLIDIPRNEYQRKKRFRELEEIRRKMMEEAKTNSIREDLKIRREFFGHCLNMTFPGDVVRMNLLWTKFLKSSDEINTDEGEEMEVDDERKLNTRVYSRWKNKEEKDIAYVGKRRRMTAARKRVDNAKKRRRHEELTEEQKDTRRTKQRERYIKLTKEEKEVYMAKRKEARTKRRSREAAQIRGEGRDENEARRKEKKEARRKIRYAEMTEEAREDLRIKKFMYYVAYKAKQTKEEREKLNRAKREKVKASLTEEKKQALTEWQRKWRHGLEGEKRDRYIESVRRAVKKNWEKTRKNPEKYEKVKEKMKERQRNATANETPEKREKRLQRMRRYTAKKKLRTKHPEFSEDEIERQLDEFMATIPTVPPGSYKPRPQARRPKKPLTSVTPPEAALPLLPPVILQPPATELPDDAPQNVIVCQYTLPDLPSGGTTTTQFSLQLQPLPIIQENPFTQLINSSSSEEIGTTTTSFYIPVTTTGGAEQFIEINQLASVSVPEATCHVSVSVEDSFPDHNHGHDHHNYEDEHFLPCELSEEPQPPPPQYNEIPLPPIPTQTVTDVKQDQKPILSEDGNGFKPKPKYTQRKDAVLCEVCGATVTKGYIHMHKELHDPNTKVKCPQCPSEFRRGRALWHHFTRVHLQQHLDLDTDALNEASSKSTHKQPQCVYCSVCEQTFDSESNFRRHFHYVHGEGAIPSNYLVCSFCPKKFKQKCTLDDHIRRLHDGIADYHCDICSRDLQSVGKLWKHKVDYHSISDLPPPPEIEVITCEFCGEKILRSYETHVKKRHPEKLSDFQANLASFPKKGDGDNSGSVPNSSQTTLISCPECNKEILRSSLKRHLRNVHRKGKTKCFPCELCKKLFKERYHLSEHVRVVHSKNNDSGLDSLCEGSASKASFVSCSFCPRKLVASSMERHMQKMHPEGGEGELRKFPCIKCNKEFKEKYHLREHIVDVHEDIDEKIRAKKLFKQISDPDTSRKRKIFKCVLCGVLSKGKHTMRIHLATHHSQLYENLRKSNSIISLDCRECPEAVSFGSEEEIRIHIELVHPDKCSRCPECDKVFLDGASNELDDHIRLEHDGEDDKDDLKMQLKMKPNVIREVKPGSKRKRRKSLSGFKYHCMRCEMKYNELEEISDHVKGEHPQNFWPCAYCKLMKYTERGLLFHSQMCAKRPRIEEEGKRPRAIKGWLERQEEQLVSFDRIPVQCEICEKTICLYSLMKHYSQVHGVQEDCWSCTICEKEFKRREYWISHMDVQHAGVGVDIDELLKEAVKMNVKDKSSLKILNAEGKRVRGGGKGIKSRSKRPTAVKRKRRRVKQQSSEDEVLCGEEDESVQKDSAFEKQLQIRVIRLTDEQISEYKMNST